MISCVITTYKRELSILKRAIDSVFNQTYKDNERPRSRTAGYQRLRTILYIVPYVILSWYDLCIIGWDFRRY